MKKYFTMYTRSIFAGLLFLVFQPAFSQSTQTLSIKDFAIWGGSADTKLFNSNQGVSLRNGSTVQGNIGSNHFVRIMLNSNITGSIYSGNGIDIGLNSRITGNLFASNMAPNFRDTSIFVAVRTQIIGNLTANGRIIIPYVKAKLSTVSGTVSVPAPTNTNYIGINPGGGRNNTVVIPSLPKMPVNTPFDNQVGQINVNTTRVLSPGVYRNLELRGNQTITFDGPGNYIFDEVFNTGTNHLIYDFKNTTEGTINLYIKNEAQFGLITTRAVNGDFVSRIFTEVHGNGTKRRNPKDGVAFVIQAPGPYPVGRFLWLGNVWAPNGHILIRTTSILHRPQIMGALWSGTRVDINDVVTITYTPPASSSISFIEPYYEPPVQGKESDPNNLIGAELTALSKNPDPIQSIPENVIYQFDPINYERVLIEVISKIPNDNALKQALIDLGMTGIVENGPHIFIITGYFPIVKLNLLNTDNRIEYVRPWYPPVSNRGQVSTQGDTTMRSYIVRERFGLDGSGIKIGVISDSYDSRSRAQNDINQSDLPGLKTNGDPKDNGENVQILQDLSQNGKDEGRAMLQIVHDIAPKAKLAFRTGFLSAGDFANGIMELADPNLPGGRCDIIVDDLSYITEPFFRDGVIAKVVDKVVAEGVTYVTSAGNFGKKSFEGVFNGVSNTSIIPAPGLIHKFGANESDIYQSIRLKPGNYTIVLQWDEEFHSLGEVEGVKTDMDLYIVGANNFRLFGFNRSNLFGDPFEVCPFTVEEETVAKLMIVKASGNSNVRFKYIIFRGDGTILDYNDNTSTIVGHANSNGAISVGAMFYESRPEILPAWPAVSSFSSRGGTFVKENNAFITRNKPDLIGPNGGNTTVDLGGAFFNDGDDYPNFFGTSAAAPHAAAVGALIMQGRKKFSLQTTVTPEEIRQQLISSAGKFSYLPTGFSFEGGNGFIQADDALLQIANARPMIDELKAEILGAENGSQPFNVIIKGKYLTSSTQIYMNGLPLPSVVSPDRTEVTALAQAIPHGEDPPFQLFNPAKSPSGEDGGLSEKKFFFSEKRVVVVRPVNKNRKYGQENPTFDVEITMNGILITDPAINYTPEELKLDLGNLSFSTIATAQSNAGLYGIFVERSTVLNESDPLNNRFDFVFQSGTLNVNKLALKIIPESKTLKYGEFPENISYRYESDLNGGGYTILPPEYLPEVQRLHKEYMAENGIMVLKGYSYDPDNGPLTQDNLNNLSALASFQSVANAKKYIVENGQLKALVNTLNPQDIGNQRFILETNANAISNYLTNPNRTSLVQLSAIETSKTGFLNLKSLSRGEAAAGLPNGQLKAMVNGQLMGMVNGEIEAVVNGQLRALVNGTDQDVDDIIFQNGQLRALVNGEWLVVPNGQLRALVNGTEAEFDLSVVNGQLRALVNREDEMQMEANGQLRALVNNQEVSITNGQLRALVNGQLLPLVNGELVAETNGQLRALVNGEMAVLINGHLVADFGDGLEEVTELTLVNGQLRALVNGQLRALVNGQLRALVNGEVINIDNNSLVMENGQLRALVNGQLRALVNGQLKEVLENGQLRALVNNEAIPAEKIIQLANGQLRALVNGNYLPIKNGQLRAMVNGQLRALVNGELMASLANGQLSASIDGEDLEITELTLVNGQLRAMVNGQLRALVNGQLKAMVNGELTDIDINGVSLVNGQLRALVNGQLRAMVNGQLRALVNGELMPPEDDQLNFTVFENGQLKAMVNGQLRALVNGQLKAMVNGQLKALVNGYTITNGQLKALVNGEEWVFPNGQLKALVNGQLKALVNNFDIGGTNNNARTMVLIGEDDVVKQSGDIGGMVSMPMITGLNAGPQLIIPAAFINENYEVTYGVGDLEILEAPLFVKTLDATKVYGEENPDFEYTITGAVYGEEILVDPEIGDGIVVSATAFSSVGRYPIDLYLSPGDNYRVVKDTGYLTITPKLLTVRADDMEVTIATEYEIPTPTITYDGLVGDDTEESICNVAEPYFFPASPKVINDYDRTITYSNVQINGGTNFIFATPGQALTLSGSFLSNRNPVMDCPGCFTQMHIGMGDGTSNFFSTCYDVTGSGATGNLFKNFNAPTTPGVYYITTLGDWMFYCGEATIRNHKVSDNNKLAIAVVIVNGAGTGSGEKITASVNADYNSGPGEYPITLTGCGTYNPNYNVVLENGTLTILPENDENACNNLYTINWKGNNNYMNNNEEFGTAVGGVTFSNESQEGSASFSFNGTGYIDVGTEGSVSGTGDFSVSAWVKTTSVNPMVIIQQRDEGLNGQYILKIGSQHNQHGFDPDHYGLVYFMLNDDDNGVMEIYSTTRVNDGNWHHIKGVRTGNTLIIYIDNLLNSTVNTSGTVYLNNSIKTFIGADYRDNASYFNGLIDDVQVEICNMDPGGAPGSASPSAPEGPAMLSQKAVVEVKEKVYMDKLYPNPASTTIRVELTEDAVNINEIQVVDGFGKVRTAQVRKINDGVYELNVSGLSKGIYFIKARTASGIKAFKFIKM